MSFLHSRRSPPQKDEAEIDFLQKERKRYEISFNLYVKINWRYHGKAEPSTKEDGQQDFCMCGRMLRKERYQLKKTVSAVPEQKETVCKQCVQPYLQRRTMY